MSLLSTTKSLFKREKAKSSKKTTAKAAKNKKETKTEVVAETSPIPVAGVSIAARIGLTPLMTEKGLKLSAATQTAIFQVKLTATKNEIARGIWEQYKFKALDVRTTRMRGKVRRRAQSEGVTSAWKKAYVKVEDAQKLQTGI